MRSRASSPRGAAPDASDAFLPPGDLALDLARLGLTRTVVRAPAAHDVERRASGPADALTRAEELLPLASRACRRSATMLSPRSSPARAAGTPGDDGVDDRRQVRRGRTRRRRRS